MFSINDRFCLANFYIDIFLLGRLNQEEEKNNRLVKWIVRFAPTKNNELDLGKERKKIEKKYDRGHESVIR